jgi:hypothetical protein
LFKIRRYTPIERELCENQSQLFKKKKKASSLSSQAPVPARRREESKEYSLLQIKRKILSREYKKNSQWTKEQMKHLS